MSNWDISFKGTPLAWWGEIMFAAGQSRMLRYEVGGLLLAHLINTPSGAAIGAFDGTRPFGATPARPNRFFWRVLTAQPPKYKSTSPQVIDIAGTAAPVKAASYLLLVADPVVSGAGRSQYMTDVIAAMTPP